MALSPGTRLGHYHVTALIGEGGMGQVWQATDTQLNREVALKILPDAFAEDPDRLARFQREAEVLASLNHSNIAQIHGIEADERTRALVLELVEGPTLAERIAKGPIPLAEALPIARQIAEALEVAHEAGVIHRDLKPANIKVREDGTVKVLDFGLAKGLDPAPAGDPNQSPTLAVAATQMGMIIGTAAYMSPEQARGKPVDRRADIWAFGCVLYEMLTGKGPFHDDDVSLTLSKVLQTEPAWEALPDAIPPGLRVYLERCLRKDPRQRIRDIGDVRLALDGVFDTTSPPRKDVPETTTRRVAGWRQALPWGLTAVLAVATGALSWMQSRPAEIASSTAVRFALPAPQGSALVTGQPQLISPDGSSLLLTTRQGETTQLSLRKLDQTAAAPIAGTDGAINASFSADGRWIYFVDFNRRTLNRVSVDGGTPLRLTDATYGGAVSGPNDTVLYTRSYSEGLWQVPSDGGTPQRLTTPDASQGELGHWWPQLLPDGETVLYTAFSAPIGQSRIMTYSLRTGTQTEIVTGGYHGRYLTSGHILFARGQSILGVPFDPVRLETSGAAVPVLDDVALDFTNGHASFSVSDGGTMAFLSGSEVGGHNRPIWRDRTGAVTRTEPTIDGLDSAALSTDGQRLALVLDDGGLDIWVQNLDQGGRTKVTFEASGEFGPIWAPDDSRLVYVVEEPQYHIYMRSMDGGSEDRMLHGGRFDSVPTGFSPDGSLLFFEQDQPDTGADVWMLSLDDPGAPTPLLQTPFDERLGTLSPDGRWLAYQSNESGQEQVYVRRFPELTGPYPVSGDGGAFPVWSTDGRELFFRRGTEVLTVPVTTGGEFSMERPTALFSARSVGKSNLPSMNVSRDGSFFFVERDPDAPPVRVHVVLNWFEELRARVSPS